MARPSQTMRIDIPPDLKEELRRGKRRVRVSSQTSEIEPASAVTGGFGRVGDADFQELLQSVYDGALIASLDGRIVDANARAVEFLKSSQTDLCGRSLVSIISGADDATLKTLLTSVENDRFVLIQAHCVRSDGILFPAEIAVNRLHVRGTIYLCCFIRDVTVRRQAEEMLRTVHNAIQNASTAIAISNRYGLLKFVNKAAVAMWDAASEEDLLGRDLRTLVPESEQMEAILAAVNNGSDWSGEIAVAKRQGASLHVQVSAAPNRDADDEVVGAVFSFLDVSDRKRAEEAEKHAERQRVMVESIGAACHHLGQPATVLLASLELLQRNPKGGQLSSDELLSSSIEAAESLRTMLHRLNDIAEYQTDSYIEAKSSLGYTGSRILAVRDEES